MADKNNESENKKPKRVYVTTKSFSLTGPKLPLNIQNKIESKGVKEDTSKGEEKG